MNHASCLIRYVLLIEIPAFIFHIVVPHGSIACYVSSDVVSVCSKGVINFCK